MQQRYRRLPPFCGIIAVKQEAMFVGYLCKVLWKFPHKSSKVKYKCTIGIPKFEDAFGCYFLIISSKVIHNYQMLVVRCIVMQHYVRRSQLKQLYVEGRDGIPAITAWKRPSSARCHNLKTLIYPQQQLQV